MQSGEWEMQPALHDRSSHCSSFRFVGENACCPMPVASVETNGGERRCRFSFPAVLRSRREIRPETLGRAEERVCSPVATPAARTNAHADGGEPAGEEFDGQVVAGHRGYPV